MWCQNTRKYAANLPSQQEMCGGLLLICASEICRDECNEDAVWPTVTSTMEANRGSFSTLFVAGQPTSVFKSAVAAGARHLELRNLIDRYGTQEYFDTLKLQFGFTIKGGARRLPDWLDGLGVPVAVRILLGWEPEYGDLRSTSFESLWRTLSDVRRRRIPVDEAAAAIAASAWVRPSWMPDILGAVRSPTTRNKAVERLHSEPVVDPLCAPILRWTYPSPPRLFLRLNELRISELLGTADIGILTIDGLVADRWVSKEAGGWRGKSELACQSDTQTPNLRPQHLSLATGSYIVEEFDLVDAGFSEPLMVFDLQTGESVDPSSQLDLLKDYAIVCDPDISLPGVLTRWTSKARSAFCCPPRGIATLSHCRMASLTGTQVSVDAHRSRPSLLHWSH